MIAPSCYYPQQPTHTQVSHFVQQQQESIMNKAHARFTGNKIEKKRLMAETIQQYKYGIPVPVPSLPSATTPVTVPKKSRDVVPLDRKRASSLSTHMMIEILQRKSATNAANNTSSSTPSPATSPSVSQSNSNRASPTNNATCAVQIITPQQQGFDCLPDNNTNKLSLAYILN